ncbi:MAG TPA: nicotinate-nucleotide adenylyltransferase [Solirubrobacteraceae bacterium]|nr:nicotinate-nucleotide adenylyltransferase [Solirubrobacteraceae bacterium]
MRVGVFGGTFNPPHLGHMVCAQEACVQLGLDRVMFVPTSSPPHKQVERDDPGPEHRLAMCQAAIAGDDRFEACDLEVARGGTSYTVDTLVELKRRAPDTELFLILGGDVAAGLPEWRDPDRVLSLATPALAARSGTPSAAVTSALKRVPGGERACAFDMPTIELSSTMIRGRAAEGGSIRYLVPDGVADYIERNGLYRMAAP